MKLTLRRAVTVAVSAAAITLTSGCGYIYKQETTMKYSPSDGVRADVGNVKFRNILVVSEDKTAPGRILGLAVNDSSNEVKVNLSAQGINPIDITIPAKGTYNFQDEANKKLIEPAVNTAPGSMMSIKVSDGTTTSDMNLPVVDGTLADYRNYLPTHNKPIPTKGVETTTTNPSASPISTDTAAAH